MCDHFKWVHIPNQSYPIKPSGHFNQTEQIAIVSLRIHQKKKKKKKKSHAILYGIPFIEHAIKRILEHYVLVYVCTYIQYIRQRDKNQ